MIDFNIDINELEDDSFKICCRYEDNKKTLKLSLCLEGEITDYCSYYFNLDVYYKLLATASEIFTKVYVTNNIKHLVAILKNGGNTHDLELENTKYILLDMLSLPQLILNDIEKEVYCKFLANTMLFETDDNSIYYTDEQKRKFYESFSNSMELLMERTNDDWKSFRFRDELKRRKNMYFQFL